MQSGLWKKLFHEEGCAAPGHLKRWRNESLSIEAFKTQPDRASRILCQQFTHLEEEVRLETSRGPFQQHFHVSTPYGVKSPKYFHLEQHHLAQPEGYNVLLSVTSRAAAGPLQHTGSSSALVSNFKTNFAPESGTFPIQNHFP